MLDLTSVLFPGPNEKSQQFVRRHMTINENDQFAYSKYINVIYSSILLILYIIIFIRKLTKTPSMISSIELKH